MKRATYAMVAVMLVLAASLVGCGEDVKVETLFPGQVEQLRLDQLVTGSEAMTAVDQLHSKSIPAEDAAIGRYVAPGSEMTVWISAASNAASAREQMAIMVEKMLGAPGTPFADPSRTLLNGITVHRFLGMGQSHLIFSVENRVYWISCDEDMEEPALTAFLPE